jgi:D-glycero-alpha-D-manno-heptose-7-phosphate kinase
LERRVLVSSAPTRLDFGGGWTDVPPYPEERGGFVCNLAIERRATVTITAPDDDRARAVQADPLWTAALRHARRAGLAATLTSDVPVGSGLGGSSAAGVAIAAALAHLAGEPADAATLAERSRHVEATELGIAGGRQDHYAAAYGGALGLTFEAGTRVERIPLSAATIAALEARLTVVYSGESRISADTITAVLDAYAARTARVVSALDRMAILARGMRAALHAGDLSTLAWLVDEHWVHQKSLHPRITTPRIDAIETAARAAGATGFKALGASGGGCVLVISSADAAPPVRAAVRPYGEPMDWRVATDGVRLESRPTP